MPRLVRFLLRHALIGIGVAALFVGALLAFDVARLGTLVSASPSGAIAAAALTLALGITFGSVQMGFAVMMLGTGGDTPHGGRRQLTRRPAYARVGARRPTLRG